MSFIGLREAETSGTVLSPSAGMSLRDVMRNTEAVQQARTPAGRQNRL